MSAVGQTHKQALLFTVRFSCCCSPATNKTVVTSTAEGKGDGLYGTKITKMFSGSEPNVHASWFPVKEQIRQAKAYAVYQCCFEKGN